MPGIEICAICDRRNCGVTIIVSTLGSDNKRFDSKNDSLKLICPACKKPFTVLITQLERANVSEDQLRQGFFGGRRRPHAKSRDASAN